jgi:amino acid transporter
MRPLCGAIMTAAALIGLGLFTIGYGTRYAAYAERDENTHRFSDQHWVKFSQMDTTLIVLLVLLVTSLMIGLAVAFVGLAYHHHKRQLEFLHTHPESPPNSNIVVK